MAYSHLRLRRTLAFVRMVMGIVFLVLGAHKISSLEFAKGDFSQFVWDAAHGTGAGFYGPALYDLVKDHISSYAVLAGLTELFIGVGLLLGLAVRPISVVGMLYSLNLFLATCMAPGENAPLWRYLDNEAKVIAIFFLVLLFGIGHAGENWGLGSLYHHHRHRRWEELPAGEEEKTATPRRVESFGEAYNEAEEEIIETPEPDTESAELRRLKI